MAVWLSCRSLNLGPVPDNESALLVPLRSKANTLLAGAPVAAVRRRLKFANLFYGRLLLEDGIVRMHAGPSGYFTAAELSGGQERPRWQTPAQRAGPMSGWR